MTTFNDMTDTQWNAYTILLGMNNNGPLTDEKRALFLSVDLSPFGMTDADKHIAIRKYESVVGLIIQGGVC